MSATSRRMARRARGELAQLHAVDGNLARRPVGSPRYARGGIGAQLVASAINVKITQDWGNIRWGGTEFQTEGWVHYDNCPEFHQGVNIGAHNLSRARLIGVEVDPKTNEPGTQPTDDATVQAIMAELFGGPTGQSQALAALYRHLEVAGDSWVLATSVPDIDEAPWQILSTQEVTGGTSGDVNVQRLDGVPRPVDFDSELLIRIWQPHPKRRWDADSPTRALLPVLRELSALTAMVSATVKSRLASAGILWIPSDITVPKSAGEADGNSQVLTEGAGGAEDWLDLITEAMTAPIQDPDSASAVVPMVAQVQGDQIDKILHMEFGKDLDEQIEPLRQACIKRLAVGMNLPPEILLGLGDVNHWTSWAITEDYARAYLAPKLELISDALTQFYLRPALVAEGVDADRFAVYFDLDKLVPKQISVENAQAAWDARLLSQETYMEALGFSTAQLAPPDEQIKRLIIEMLTHANPEVLVELAATITSIFPGMAITPVTPATATTGTTVGAGQDPAQVAPPAAAPSAIGAPPASSTPPTATPPGAGGV